MLEVRAARHGDAPALDALGAAPEAGVFVLEKNGAVIGALTLRAGEIFGCAVAPEWRGRGYGTFLLRRALRAAGRGGLYSNAAGQCRDGGAAAPGAGFAHRSRHCPPQGKSPPARGKPALLPAHFEPPPKMGAGARRTATAKTRWPWPTPFCGRMCGRRFRAGRDGGQRP